MRPKSFFESFARERRQTGLIGATLQTFLYYLEKAGLAGKNTAYLFREPRSGHFLRARRNTTDAQNYLHIYEQEEYAPSPTS